MYPPTPTDDPYEWLRGLWSSLQRASEHFHNEAIMEETGEGIYKVFFGFQHGIGMTKEAKVPMRAYIREYARASGWTLDRVHITQAGVAFFFSKA